MSILICTDVCTLSTFHARSVVRYITYLTHTVHASHVTFTDVPTVVGAHHVGELLTQYSVVHVLFEVNVTVTLLPVHAVDALSVVSGGTVSTTNDLLLLYVL